jgi:Na+/proline symporter
VLHDLGVIDERSLVHVLLVFVPPLIWVVAIVAKRVPNAFLTGGVIGSLYGVALAVIHQFAWASVWGDNPPRLGAKLSDTPEGLQEIIFRGLAFGSSLFTGIVVGVVTGAMAWPISRVIYRRQTVENRDTGSR